MQLRRAQGKDAKAAGLLILSSAKNSFASIFDLSESHYALAYLQYAFTFADGQFGYANHCVIDVDGQVAAIASSWHTELTARFHQATLHSIVSYYGPIDGLEVIQRCQLLKEIIPAPKKEEWCIGHFAVSPSHRRGGLGRKLLAHMQALASSKGKNKITLDVELSNQGAINFYRDSGFAFVDKPTSRALNVGGLAAHGHMFFPV